MASLLVDMNLSIHWIPLLRAAGHQAVHWSEVGDPRAPDQALMCWAAAHGYTVFTHDLDQRHSGALPQRAARRDWAPGALCAQDLCRRDRTRGAGGCRRAPGAGEDPAAQPPGLKRCRISEGPPSPPRPHPHRRFDPLGAATSRLELLPQLQAQQAVGLQGGGQARVGESIEQHPVLGRSGAGFAV